MYEMVSDSFKELNSFITKGHDLRICILDNNNVQFCTQHEKYFPVDKIYGYYDLILVPGWVYAEIAQSEHRRQYISSIPQQLLYLDEETDYLPLVDYHDLKLMKVFANASSPGSKPHRYLKKQIQEAESGRVDIDDEWIGNYYENGFDSKEEGIIKKNAGETSILALAFLLVHHYGNKIKQISISTSDFAVVEIKKKIMDYSSKHNLLNVPTINPISFLSTDVLLARAFRMGMIGETELIYLRKSTHRKRVICIVRNNDSTVVPVDTVMETEDFLQLLKGNESYDIIF